MLNNIYLLLCQIGVLIVTSGAHNERAIEAAGESLPCPMIPAPPKGCIYDIHYDDNGCIRSHNLICGYFFGDECELPKKAGMCRGAFRRFYYNAKLKRCERFIYGGCGGNDNRFRTMKECSSRCHTCRQPADSGPCEAAISSWYFDATTDTCRTFVYGGCEGNENRFESRETCESKCVVDKK